ncbi:proteasome assembly chaperone 2 [Brevipalpus obovatus]|uniref:proteasome assembly chaperone 2 n=1 Tax=Brevipalpus obovatus TaxID=246614 RepID=UPI003D9EF9DD
MKNVNFYNPIDSKLRVWKDYTLVMPCIAIGNVGQLSVDLLISTMLRDKKCQLVGRIHSRSLQSVAGPNAFNHEDPNLTTTCEVYEIPEKHLVVIQIRAPPYKERRKLFIKEFSDWIQACQFKTALTLTSGLRPFLNPAIRDRTLFRFLTTSPCQEEFVENFIDKTQITKLSSDIFVTSRSITGLDFAGAGYARLFYREWESRGMNALFIILFCSEGDNLPEAYAMVNKLDAYLNLSEGPSNPEPRIEWKPPVSWSSFYGKKVPQEINE